MFETQNLKQHSIKVLLLTAALLLNSSAGASTESVPIVGGNTVSANSAIGRRTVGLFFIQKDNKQSLCTGSILDSSHILTAAHCIQNLKQAMVLFSPNMIQVIQNVSANGIAKTPEARVVTNAKEQPGYNGQAGGDSEFNDLAILTFAGGLVAGYEAAHFLSKADALNVLASHTPVVLAGYGVTTPPSVAATAADPNKGSGTLRQVAVSFDSMSPHQIDIFVAGPEGHDACSGDSGGPAMVQVNGETFVIGVASRSDCMATSIYTFVHSKNLGLAKRELEMAAF